MKYKYGILISVIVILLGIQQYFIWTTPRVDSNQILLNKISQLESKIDSLNFKKDSIKAVIDSTHVKIITNEKHYQERINTIITRPLSIDSQYISDYIGRYIESHKSYFQ
jgi:hypothetical protein